MYTHNLDDGFGVLIEIFFKALDGDILSIFIVLGILLFIVGAGYLTWLRESKKREKK